MRIDLNSNTAASGAHVERAMPSHAAHPNSVQKNAPQVAESDANVGKLAAAALNAPEARTERVQSLQSQIKAGTYHVSAEQVAHSMLQQMRLQKS
jgi:flagellar biosynthesis anti-sigma factor FlgM